MANRFPARILVAVLALGIMADGTARAAQQQIPIGALHASGEVWVNSSSVAGGVTLFAGDALRTGTNGTATLAVTDRGTLLIGPQTQITFPATYRYFASLQQGTLGVRALATAGSFQIQIGDFVIVPHAANDSASSIARAADGSTQVLCTQGSVGVIALEGEAAVFLGPGQTANITAQGSLGTGAPAVPSDSQPAPPAQPPKAPPEKKSKKGVIILIAAGAGVGGAVAAMAGKKKSSPSVSPSVP